MRRRKVVHSDNIPTSPISVAWRAALLWLLMDRLKAPAWLWGAVWAILLVCFAVSLVLPWFEEKTHIWPEDK